MPGGSESSTAGKKRHRASGMSDGAGTGSILCAGSPDVIAASRARIDEVARHD